MFWSFGKSTLPSLISTIMVKPLELPIPWIAGGTITSPTARQLVQLAAGWVDDRAQILALLLQPDAPILQDHIFRRAIGQRGAVVEHRDAGDLDRLVHARGGEQILLASASARWVRSREAPSGKVKATMT